MKRLARGLIGLYPAQWRTRYADEFAVVLAATIGESRGPRAARLVLDVLRGAADARGGGGATTVAFYASIAFAVAGGAFAKMTEDRPFHAVASAHPLVGIAFDVVFYGALVAGFAVAAGGAPVLLAILGRPRQRRWLLVPPLCAAAWRGVLALAGAAAHGSRIHSPANLAAFAAVVLAGIAAAAISARALDHAARGVELGGRAQRLALCALSAAMLTVTAAGLVWGLALHADSPQLFHSNSGLLASALPATWIASVVGMALASAVALAATTRAVRLAERG